MARNGAKKSIVVTDQLADSLRITLRIIGASISMLGHMAIWFWPLSHRACVCVCKIGGAQDTCTKTLSPSCCQNAPIAP